MRFDPLVLMQPLAGDFVNQAASAIAFPKGYTGKIILPTRLQDCQCRYCSLSQPLAGDALERQDFVNQAGSAGPAELWLVIDESVGIRNKRQKPPDFGRQEIEIFGNVN